MLNAINDKLVAKRITSLAVVVIVGMQLSIANAYDQQSTPSPRELKKLSIEELMEIEVTSVSKRPEKLSETPSAIQVITSEEIRRSGATSIPEALRLATNLQVAQKNSSGWGISARGFNTDLANKLLVLIDGRAVYTPLYSGVFWSRQDYLLEDIDRIEVISGPGGTLWGANAINGVINIITKSAQNSQDLYMEQGAGSELRGTVSARYGGKLSNNSHYRVYGKYVDRDNGEYENGLDANDSWKMSQFGFRMDTEVSPKSSITLQGDYYSSDQKVLTGGTSDLSGGNILSRWRYSLSNNSDMSLQLYYDRTSLKLPTAAFIVNSFVLAPAGQFEDDLDTYDADFNHRFQLGQKHQIIWGLGFRFTHDELSNSPALGFLPEKLEQSLFSTFVQDEVALIEDLTFTIGSKIEHNDYTDWEVEPNARLRWQVNQRHMLWAAVSRAVRAPSRIDRDVTQATPPNFVILVGGPDFESETVIAYELGHRLQIGTDLVAAASVFYNDYDDIRSTSFTPTVIFPLFFENNLEAETHGLELNAKYQAANWWQLQGGYTFLKSDFKVKPGEMDFNETLNETSDPRHQVSVFSTMDLSKRMELDTRLRWVDVVRTHSGFTPGGVPNYMELDVRVACQLVNELELSVVGQNLLQDRHPEFGYPDNSRVEIQRSVFGKATWRF